MFGGPSLTLQQHVTRMVKEAEEQTDAVGQQYQEPNGNSSYPQPRAGADGSVADQLDKLAGAAEYVADNPHLWEDDRTPAEKIASLHAFSSTFHALNKLAADICDGCDKPKEECTCEDNAADNSDAPPVGEKKEEKEAAAASGEQGTLQTNCSPISGTQTPPHKGSKIIPTSTKADGQGKMETNETTPAGGKEDWSARTPIEGKTAGSRILGRPKTAQVAPPMGGAPPAGPTPVPAGPAPAAAPAGAPPMGAAPPAAPAQPDPVQIAMQLAQQGQLNPQTLSQQAGISPEEATSVIAALVGTPSAAPAAGTQPPAPPAPPADPAAGGAPPKMAGAESVYLRALSKLGADENNPAKVAPGMSNKRPEDEDTQTPSGGSVVHSTESIQNADGEQVRAPRRSALASLFKAPIPIIHAHGTGDKPNVDRMLSSKTAEKEELPSGPEGAAPELPPKKPAAELAPEDLEGGGEMPDEAGEEEENMVLAQLLESMSPKQKAKLSIVLQQEEGGELEDEALTEKESMGGGYSPPSSMGGNAGRSDMIG